ncbi:MAG: hypothetical protein ABR598_00765 [Candidatus Dormibacteria bacterium]
MMSEHESTSTRQTDRMEEEPEVAQGASDTEHWARSYRDVISFEEKILSRMRELAAEESAHVQAEIYRTNIQPMEELIEDFKARARRWDGEAAAG